jgi:hypothetical protein
MRIYPAVAFVGAVVARVRNRRARKQHNRCCKQNQGFLAVYQGDAGFAYVGAKR